MCSTLPATTAIASRRTRLARYTVTASPTGPSVRAVIPSRVGRVADLSSMSSMCSTKAVRLVGRLPGLQARQPADGTLFTSFYAQAPSFPVLMARVLVVDDEPAVRRALERALTLDNYTVELAADGQEALDALATSPADAVVLDVMMPRIDGLEVARRMRRAGDRTPILMLTARDAVDDRVTGLDVGADDYLVKPFALRELQARLRALLRRTGEGDGQETLRFADMALDPVAHEVQRGERQIELTKTEFLLLELFMRHPRQVLTRSQIFESVWGYDFGPTSNALGVYMGYLRRKTEARGEPRLLHTVRGVGYILRD